MKRLSASFILLIIFTSFLAGVVFVAKPVFATVYVSDNFENFTTGWTVGTGGSGTVTKSNTQVHGGSWAGKYFSIGSGDQAYTTRSWSPAPTGDNHHSIWFYQMSTYTGATLFLLAEYGDGSKWCAISGITYHNSAWWFQNANTSWVDVCTVTADTWHQLDVYYNYTSGKLHFYIDQVKQGGDWGSYSNSASIKPTVCYLGDTSTTTTLGDGYCFLDDFSIDNAPEPSAIPVAVASSHGTNTTITVSNWLFYSQWYLTTGTLSGYIFCYNVTTSLVNETWVAFSDTNNSWANVSKTVSIGVGSVIQWGIYANGSTNCWCVLAWQYVTVTALVTFYFNDGGFARCNATNMGNGTGYSFNTLASVASLAALPNDTSYFLNFTWSVGVSGSSTTNGYNLTVYNATTVWCYFSHIPSPYIVAVFNFTPTNPAINDWVTFNASMSVSSGAIANYTWNFGDSSSWSTGVSVTIQKQYTSNATFLVTLIVGGDVGNSTALIEALVIGWGDNHTCLPTNHIEVAFTWSPNNPASGAVVSFDASQSNSSASITDYKWEFGDANTTQGVYQTITHIYNGNDTYAIKLTITSTVGTADITHPIVIGWGNNHTCPPTAHISVSFIWSPDNPDSGEEVSLDATSCNSSSAISNYEWDFGDSNVTSGNYDTITHTYNGNDTYLVTLEITGSVGTAFLTLPIVVGWGANHTCVISGGGAFLSAVFNFTPSNPANATLVSFDGTYSNASSAITDWSWDFGDGNVTAGVYPTIDHPFATDGTYLIKLTITTSDGTIDLWEPITVGGVGGGMTTFGYGVMLFFIIVGILAVIGSAMYVRSRD